MKKIKSAFHRHGLVHIAFGVTVGHSAGDFLNSMVEDLIMPVVAFFVVENDWKTDTISLGGLELKWGQVMANGLHFAVVALVIFYFLLIFEKEVEEGGGEKD
jgi:Large-conductance mechanosensitive channel